MSEQPAVIYRAAPTITLTEALKRLKAHIDVVQDGNGQWGCASAIEYLLDTDEYNGWLPIESSAHPLPEQALDAYIAHFRNHRLRNRVGERSSWSFVRSSPYVYLDLTRLILVVDIVVDIKASTQASTSIYTSAQPSRSK